MFTSAVRADLAMVSVELLVHQIQTHEVTNKDVGGYRGMKQSDNADTSLTGTALISATLASV